MKKTCKIFLICIALSMCLSALGCSSYSFEDKVQYILFNQVPFASSSEAQSHFYNYEEIETDSYGRQLVFCEIPGVSGMNDFFGNGSLFVYLIIQKTESEQVWVYDNDCYLYVNDRTTGNSNLDDFKIANDWNQPLLEEKMIQCISDKDMYYKTEKKEYDSLWENNQSVQIGEESFTSDDIVIEGFLRTANQKSFFIVRHMIQSDHAPIYGKTYLFTITDGQIMNVKELIGTPVEWKEQIREYKTFLDEN